MTGNTLLDLLYEVATELDNLDGSSNPVLVRLRKYIRELTDAGLDADVPLGNLEDSNA